MARLGGQPEQEDLSATPQENNFPCGTERAPRGSAGRLLGTNAQDGSQQPRTQP